MRVARILYPVNVLGPGDRIGIWVSGCNRRCPGCANPELWTSRSDQEISVDNLKLAITSLTDSLNHQIDGVTISGGEPFDQPEQLYELIQLLREYTSDILVYSGYTRAQLLQSEERKKNLSAIAVLVDGAYQQENNKGQILSGSVNQKIYYKDQTVKERYEAYLEQQKGKHLVQNFRTKNGVIAVGIHKKDFKESLDRQLVGNQIKHK